MVNLKSLLNGAMKLGASDIHLIEGVKPYLRITGDLRRVDAPKLTANDMSKVLRTILPEHLNDVLQREQLSLNLKGTLTQRLVKTADGNGRIAAMEIMLVNSVVAKLIKDNRVPDIFGIIRGREDDMQTIDQALADLVRDKIITFEHGKKACDDFYAYKRFIAGMAASGDRGAITAMA